MSKHEKHVPKHRGEPPRHVLVQAPRTALRRTLVCSSVAVAATGVTVGGGLIGGGPAAVSAAADLTAGLSGGQVAAADGVAPASATVEDLQGARAQQARQAAFDRSLTMSRSADRTQVSTGDTATLQSAAADKQASLSTDGGPAVSGSENLAAAAPTDIARSLLGNYGWDQSQFSCLYDLWQRESGWNVHAANPGSGAYGIPQSLPGSKMASAGPDWADNPVTQITWGLGYISERYGSPCGAWGHSQSFGWY